jgi:hypothetical protein
MKGIIEELLKENEIDITEVFFSNAHPDTNRFFLPL